MPELFFGLYFYFTGLDGTKTPLCRIFYLVDGARIRVELEGRKGLTTFRRPAKARKKRILPSSTSLRVRNERQKGRFLEL